MGLTRIERCRQQVAYWQAQHAQVARDRAQLVWIGRGGALLAAVAVVAGGEHRLMATAAVLGLTVVTWLLGLYMTAVRRAEFAYNIAEAEAALEEAEREGNVIPPDSLLRP